MAVTLNEILTNFPQGNGTAIAGNDENTSVLVRVSLNGTVVGQAFTVAEIRAYILSGLLSVDADGNLVVNGTTQNLTMLRNSGGTLQVSYDGGGSWENLGAMGGGGSMVVVSDTLTDRNGSHALSARQGAVLDGMVMRYRVVRTINNNN